MCWARKTNKAAAVLRAWCLPQGPRVSAGKSFLLEVSRARSGVGEGR